jgi:hypothetical protein
MTPPAPGENLTLGRILISVVLAGLFYRFLSRILFEHPFRHWETEDRDDRMTERWQVDQARLDARSRDARHAEAQRRDAQGRSVWTPFKRRMG